VNSTTPRARQRRAAVTYECSPDCQDWVLATGPAAVQRAVARTGLPTVTTDTINR